MRRLLCTSVAVLAAGSGVASAATPDPVAGESSCGGLIVATFNHNSIGAGNPESSSAGPGYFLGQDTSFVIQLVRAINC